MEYKEIIKDAYYYDKTGMLLRGDCLEWMPKFPSKSIDMILCDLPYGTTSCNWDSRIPLDVLWKQYERIIKDNGAIVLTASQPFTSILVTSNIKLFKYEIIWEKEKPANIFFSKTQVLKYHENVLVFSKSGAHNMSAQKMKYNPQMEKRNEKNKRKNAPRINDNDGIFGNRIFVNEKSTGNDDFIYPKSIQKINTDRNIKLHPTQKPVALFEWLIRTYTDEEEIVLDNTAGSCTTAVASKNSNRKWICIEQEKKYCDISVKRIKEMIK